jgi:hypothetical protein
MTRYVAIAQRPRAQWDIWEKPATVTTSMTVYEADDKPEDTGLLDYNGTPLYRVRDRTKMGYR